MKNSFKHHNKQGYTLVELLVVIAIMIVSLAFIFPAINHFIKTISESTAKNSVNTAVTAIRAYAGSSTAGLNPDISTSTFSGVALIVTPANTIRLTINDQFAQSALSGTPYMEEIASPNGPCHGYKDIEDRGYINLPKDAGIVGIYQTSGFERYIAPPFAIHFNKEGQLIPTDPDDPSTFVFYDADDDGYYLPYGNGANRKYTHNFGNRYDFDKWNPEISTSFSGTSEPYNLPFERIEAVIGVIVYSKTKLREDGGDDWPANNDGYGWPSPYDGFANWLKDNGEALFFSRYTGTIITEK